MTTASEFLTPGTSTIEVTRLGNNPWEFDFNSLDLAIARFRSLYGYEPSGSYTVYMVWRDTNTVFEVYVVYKSRRPKLNLVLKEVIPIRNPIALASKCQIQEFELLMQRTNASIEQRNTALV